MLKDGLVWEARAWQNVANWVGVRVLDLKRVWRSGIVSLLVLMVGSAVGLGGWWGAVCVRLEMLPSSIVVFLCLPAFTLLTGALFLRGFLSLKIYTTGTWCYHFSTKLYL